MTQPRGEITLAGEDVSHEFVVPSSDVLSRCPFCDTSFCDTSFGLDVRDDEYDWTPCCESMRHAVARDGWREIFGESLSSTLLREVGVVPSSVVD